MGVIMNKGNTGYGVKSEPVGCNTKSGLGVRLCIVFVW